jgi:hypothetical protein
MKIITNIKTVIITPLQNPAYNNPSGPRNKPNKIAAAKLFGFSINIFPL